jgi:hypothetical protein
LFNAIQLRSFIKRQLKNAGLGSKGIAAIERQLGYGGSGKRVDQLRMLPIMYLSRIILAYRERSNGM